MGALGYSLPGTVISEKQKVGAVSNSTSQRKPVIIGKASPYKKVTYESVIRSSTGNVDTLSITNGIHTISKIGSKKGLNDIVVGTDVTVSTVAGTITWTPVADALVISAFSAVNKTITLTTGLTRAVQAGKFYVEYTINATTYQFIIAQDAALAATTITVSGDLSVIDITDPAPNVTAATLRNVVKVPTNSTYYVSYDYTRPTSDYVYKEFSDFSDVVADLGEKIPDNDIVMLAYLGLEIYKVPTIGVVQVAGTTSLDYIDAIDKTSERDVQTLCVLSSNATVRGAAITHVNNRSLPEIKRERTYWTGPASLTVLGDDSNLTSIKGIAAQTKNERVVFVNATRAKYYYKDPTTSEEKVAAVDGSFIGAALALYRDSFAYAAQPILGHTIPGLTLYDEDYDAYYTEPKLTSAGASSCMVLGPGASGIYVYDDLTTDNTSVEKNNVNIITAKDYIAKDVRCQMDRVFKGVIIKNRATHQENMDRFLANLFKAYKAAEIIESIGTTSATLDTIRRDKAIIYYSYYSVYTQKYIEGSYELLS